MKILKNIIIIIKRYIREMSSFSMVLIIIWLVIFAISEGVKILIPSILIEKLYNSKDIQNLIIPILLMVVIMISQSLLSFKVYRSFMQYRLKEVGNLNARCLLLPIFLSDSKKGQENIESAQRAVSYGNDMGLEAFLKSTFNLIAVILSLIVYLIFAIKLPLWIVVLMFVTPLLKIPLENKRIKHENNSFEEIIPYWDDEGRLKRNCLDESFGKESRIYALHEIIGDKFDKINIHTIKFFKNIISKKLNTDAIFRIIMIIKDVIIIYAFINIPHLNITAGSFVLYLGILLNLGSQIESAYENYSKIKSNNIYVKKFINFFISPKYNEYGNNSKLPYPPYSLTFENVSFSYDPEEKENKKYILKDINFTIKSGEKIGIVGRNGVGKTTLVKLICGFYTPNKGRILLNNVDINSIDIDEYYKLLSVIFQKNSVYAMSVAENIALCKKEDIDFKKIKNVIEKAELKEVIEQLPEKENTELTHYLKEKGILLSGGQTQKLMLARALYKQSDILILDEPTSSFDPIAESKLYKKYNEFSHSKISFFISHRLVSTLFCDKIILLENGTITETGTHNELPTF